MKRLFLATVLFTLAILSGGNMQGQEVTVIASYQDFLNIPDSATGNYKQTADIEFPNNKFPAKSFAGTYDGQGFSIKSSGTQNKTLFNEISGGEVKNLVIDRVTVSEGQPTSGGLLCRKFSNGRIENITVTNCNYSTSTILHDAIPSGGLIGIMNGGTVSNCCVKGTTITSREVAGGLIGQMTGGTVEYSSSVENTVSAERATPTLATCYAGGIAGEISGGTINACYASGTVRTKNGGSSKSYACGIAGNPSSSANSVTISNCYNGTDKGATHGNTTNTNVISGGNDNLNDIIAVLNSGLTSPAFVVENGEIVTVTAADGGVYESKASGSRFDIKSTWEKTSYATSPKYIIRSSTSASIEPGVTLPEGIEIEIKYGGSLINKTDNAVRASLRTPTLKMNYWTLMGFPVEGESDLAPLAADDAPDIWALAFKYGENKWDEGNFLHYNDGQQDKIQAGNSIMAYSSGEYSPIVTGQTLNRSLTVTNNVSGSDAAGRWMALANPYPAAIDPSAVINSLSVQGQVLYVYTPEFPNNVWLTAVTSIPAGSGFMVNMPEGRNSFTFDKSMIKGYANSNTPAAKSAVAKRDFLTVSVSTDGYKVPVMFAKNEAAREDYDIFDANKLFGDGSLAEPYLLCNGINLCKEEVNSLPYTATMNIKSGEARSVEIIAENIPEGYSLVLLDGEEEIAMNQGDIHTVNIASGENADRFKLKIGEKNVSITDIEAAEELSIRNNNRNIIIEGGKNIRAEVYNTLGQKVYETTARNFNIEGVAAGAYVIKVQSGKAVQSQKVIIR